MCAGMQKASEDVADTGWIEGKRASWLSSAAARRVDGLGFSRGTRTGSRQLSGESQWLGCAIDGHAGGGMVRERGKREREGTPATDLWV